MTQVTAAVIRKGEKFLICQRPFNKSCGGLWEFPGGKTEPGESLFECIIRECNEELNISVKPKKIITSIENNGLEITFIECEIVSGDITLVEHNDCNWISVTEIHKYEFCPSDTKALPLIINEEK